MLYGARHPGHAAGLILQSTMASFDLERLVEGFRRVAGDRVADLARRAYTDRSETREEWAEVFAAFGPHVQSGEELARRIQNPDVPPGVARLEVVAGAGHMIWLDDPEGYWRRILTFVDRVTDPGSGPS